MHKGHRTSSELLLAYLPLIYLENLSYTHGIVGFSFRDDDLKLATK